MSSAPYYHQDEKVSAGYEGVILWAATCVGFFGFLRVGEFTVPSELSYDPQVHFSLSDLLFDDHRAPIVICLRIKQSKSLSHENINCKKPREHVNIMYYNVRSLLPKLDELRIVCETEKPGIVCIVESWLDNSISDNEISIPTYQLFRHDRNRHGGGVAIYVHFSFICNVILKAGPFDLEFISVSLLSRSSFGKFCLCLFYRPPSSPVSVLDNLCTTLQIVNPVDFSNFLLLGDFNVDFCNPEHHLFSHVSNILLSFSLTQVVPSPTHVSHSGTSSLIDLAMLANIEQLQQCSTIPPLSTSDHCGISLTLAWTIHRATPCNSRKVWLYREGDYDKACRMIEESDWNTILAGSDVNKAAENWSDHFLAIMEQCIPQRYLRKRPNLPWLTKHIIQLIRRRNILFKRAKKTRKEAHFAQYKAVRNKVVGLIRYNKKLYFNNLASSGSKMFWKSIKLLNKNRQTIPSLHCDDQIISDNKQKAEILNTFFASCWNSMEQPLDDDTHHTAGLSQFEDTFVSAEEVFNLIINLNTDKASGPDGISALMLKATANSIASPLAELFSLSLRTGKFPKLWKLANVVPIPKSNDKSDPSNYRPVSLLSIVRKILEKIVYSRLWEHIVEHAPLSVCQWGFQKHRSTTTALLFATHEWYTYLDKQKDVICIFFDYRKAFDSVPHRRLMDKLSQIGFHPLILAWICSYLSNREQVVLVNGDSSQPIAVCSGVPQGSVLGPLLFLLYIDDITKLILSKNTRLVLYADDYASL